jgi:thioredoxin reductase (NADPH)
VVNQCPKDWGIFVFVAGHRVYDLLIIGAGPAGLACAIEAKTAKLKYAVFDKGNVVNSIYRFPTEMVFFSTPELLEIGGMPFVTSDFRPSRIEASKYYQRVVEHFGLLIHSYEEVKAVSRRSNYFQVSTSKNGLFRTRNLVFATGYFDNPRRLGVKGEELPNVFHYFYDPYPFFGSRVAVVGGKNSAVETALSLHRHGAQVRLIHRGSALSRGVKYWILPDIENRIKEGSIEAFFNSTVKEIHEDSIVVVNKRGRSHVLKNDFVFVQIGYDPDVELLRSSGVKVNNKSLVPKHNPSTMETNIKGVYIAGSIAAGKENNKIFIENGRLHGGLIVKSILSKR